MMSMLLYRTQVVLVLLAPLLGWRAPIGEKVVHESSKTTESQSCILSYDGSNTVGDDDSNTSVWNMPKMSYDDTKADLSEQERERIVKKIIEDTEAEWRNLNGKEQKLLKMLEEWETIYLPKRKEGLTEWYELAKRDVFTLKGLERMTEEDGSEWQFSKQRARMLFLAIEYWKNNHEEWGREALYDFYGEVRGSVFGLTEEDFRGVKEEYDDEEEERTDPLDPWRVSSWLDSHHGTHRELREYFECGDLGERDVNHYNERKVWDFMRYHYLGVVGPEKSSLPSLEGSGFLVDVEFQHIEGKGRGVVATQFIPKNTLVANGFRFAAMFDNAADFRRFILSLPTPLACDSLTWSYVETFDEFDPETLRMVVDLDGQGMINNGNEDKRGDDDDTEYSNIEPIRGSGMYFATRDIQAGEELQCNYDDFETKFYRWGYFGM